MQKRLLLLSTFLLLNMGLFAQNSIQLNIHHLLGDADFEMNSGAINNIQHDFNVSRLEYYISTISIIHDGGDQTAIEDLYILVDATEGAISEIDLGMHDISEIEGIKFHIGIDEAHNHLDPSSYAPTHPLAPQAPSMHWGWLSGYRFLAIEGKGGNAYNQVFQLHGLEDENYFSTEISLPITSGDMMTIDIDADYTRCLEDIQVNSGIIVHGGYGEAKKALENFRDYVFSPSAVTSSTVDFTEVNSFEVYPNPAVEGTATFLVSSSKNGTYQVLVSDILGKKVQQFDTVKGNEEVTLNLNNSGLYVISLLKNGETIITQKLVVD